MSTCRYFMSQLAAYTRKVDKRGRPGHMHAVHWYYVIISCSTYVERMSIYLSSYIHLAFMV